MTATTDRSSLVVGPELEHRIAAVERVLLADHGPWHVPDAKNELRYYRDPADARVQRRLEAERRVRAHDARVARLRQIAREQSETLAEAIGAGVVARPTLRQMAERQRAEYEATGKVTLVGDEA